MEDRIFTGLTYVAIVGSALMAGIFFIFSVAIMTALNRLPPAQGIRAMQQVNLVIVNPLFLLAFLGTGIAGAVLIVRAARHWGEPGMPWLLIGSVLYIVGALLVSFIFNIPRNDALAELDPASPAAAATWATYVAEWTAWNHVRTILTIAATVALIVSLDTD